MYSLTVLICVHSTQDFYDDLLIKALDSLVNQTYKNFETVIVLDGCWNNTKEKIENLNLPLAIRFYEKPKPEGLGIAKNFGLSKINSDLVAFLDGDDLYIETKLEKQIEYFNSHDDVDFLGTHAFNLGYLGGDLYDSVFDVNTNITNQDICSSIFGGNVLTHGSMMIRKRCLDELGGYNNYLNIEDWNLWQRACQAGYKFYQLPERLYVFRLGTSQPRFCN
jgi:glycosyltransferase involved in cell wall biosynthesis